MPLYEYRCVKCGAQFEKIRKFSDPPLTTCEKCGGSIERLLSSPAIQFKGSGWYVTDYAGKSSSAQTDKAESTPTGKTESSSASASSKPSESKTGKSSPDTKPPSDK